MKKVAHCGLKIDISESYEGGSILRLGWSRNDSSDFVPKVESLILHMYCKVLIKWQLRSPAVPQDDDPAHVQRADNDRTAVVASDLQQSSRILR